ncbi:leucine rich repeat-containing protein [Cystoisospora suis]|uniref:Leucine rich repeat-containing protein n=1 Tax=Cystoisospora suis TaxID=483139 RepID=A0A2C6LCQ8_9APIC|nr:leucine rich repeat-containing protein [Cystoisospora suis]
MAKPKKEKKPVPRVATDQVPLAGEVLDSSLTDVARTVDGSGYAFVRLNCTGKNITTIPEEISTYIYLRYIDISDNHLVDILPFTKLPHVLSLNAARNNITDISYLADDACLPSCAVLNLSNNSISKLGSIGLQRLAKLTLDGNPVTSFEGVEKLPETLCHLSLKDTNMSTLSHLPALPSLSYLSLSYCPLNSLLDVSTLVGLEILDITGVKLPDITALKMLLMLPLLRELIVSPCDPEISDEEFRQEVLVILHRLKRLNGVDVTPEEKKRAKALKLQRKREQEEQEAQRKREEEERAREAEERVAEEEGEEPEKEGPEDVGEA